MREFERIKSRLHSLYRQTITETTFLGHYIKAVADVLEDVAAAESQILQSHWSRFANRGVFSPFLFRTRELLDAPIPETGDQDVILYPYLEDLARLGGLLSIPPWESPLNLRETAESYRKRVDRTVRIFSDGLATLPSVQRIVEAHLPVELDAPTELIDRPFWIEEFAPLTTRTVPIRALGEPEHLVGPLMRWDLQNDDLANAAPTVYIEGQEAIENEQNEAVAPIIERYKVNGAYHRAGIAFRDTISPGETVRLRPAYASWLGVANGVRRARSTPSETPADPTAPGPWRLENNGPSNRSVSLIQTQDHMLWAATDLGGASELWRYNGLNWERILVDLSQIHCMEEENDRLLLGTANGLLGMPLYPEEGDPFSTTVIAGTAGRAILCLFKYENSILIGTSEGVLQKDPQDGLQSFGIDSSLGTGVPVYSIHKDETDSLFFGNELGVFQLQPRNNSWYWFSGGQVTDRSFDWVAFDVNEDGVPLSLPPEEEVFLPPVRVVFRGPDKSLWLGTTNGIARYVARQIDNRGMSFETIIEAFPDLSINEIHAISQDERSLVWFGTERGLLRFDGMDWWQATSTTWTHLGDARFYEGSENARNAWRFIRSDNEWERLDGGVFFPAAPDLRTSNATAVHAIVWTDMVDASIGTGTGIEFEPEANIDVRTRIQMRFKPDEQTIIAGGIPAIPRVPKGTSTWRYLSREDENAPAPVDLPFWNTEGRLFPPPEHKETRPGRYDLVTPPIVSEYDEAVFAYLPAAKVTFTWAPSAPLTVLTRIKHKMENEHIDPVIIDRVWQGLQLVRPAGVNIALAVEESIKRGI